MKIISSGGWLPREKGLRGDGDRRDSNGEREGVVVKEEKVRGRESYRSSEVEGVLRGRQVRSRGMCFIKAELDKCAFITVGTPHICRYMAVANTLYHLMDHRKRLPVEGYVRLYSNIYCYCKAP